MAALPAIIISPPQTTINASASESAPNRRTQKVEPIRHRFDEARARQHRPDARQEWEGPERDGSRPINGTVASIGTAAYQRNPEIAHFASTQFLAQALGQDLGAPAHVIGQHRDAFALGSDAYRRVGAEPTYYSEEPEIFRVAV